MKKHHEHQEIQCGTYRNGPRDEEVHADLHQLVIWRQTHLSSLSRDINLEVNSIVALTFKNGIMTQVL
jgi:hypothetical protein